MSCIFGENRDIFFPKLSENLHLTTFSEIAQKYITQLGYEPYECESEDEARDRSNELINQKKWPCYFFKSDTTGEKDFEEFYTVNETLDLERFKTMGIIRNDPLYEAEKLSFFEENIETIKNSNNWNRGDIVALFHNMIPNFGHKETGKFLHDRM
jgi:hypothetical protein